MTDFVQPGTPIREAADVPTAIAARLAEIRGILFDKDGVLLDYEGTFGPQNRAVVKLASGGDPALAERLMVECGYAPGVSRAAAGSLFAAGSLDEIADAMVATVAPDDPAALRRRILDAFNQAPGRSVLTPSCRETLATLADGGYTLGIATNDSEQSMRATLAPHDVLTHFAFTAGYDSGYGAKPAPGMALAFFEATGLAPREVMFVGDNVHDLDCGAAAKCGLTVGVLSGTGAAEDLTPRADLLIDDIGVLPGLLAPR